MLHVALELAAWWWDVSEIGNVLFPKEKNISIKLKKKPYGLTSASYFFVVFLIIKIRTKYNNAFNIAN